MWFRSPPPPTDRWALHVAATTAQVTAALRELCIDGERPRYNGDEQFPVYLCGSGSPYGPPEWMGLARAELNRRGHATRWCTPQCRHHPWPPCTAPEQPAAGPARDRGRGRAGRIGPRTPVHRLTSRVLHHREPAPGPAPAAPRPPRTALPGRPACVSTLIG